MPQFQYIGLQQSTTKVLSLWNGTANVAPPTNWNAVGFDDSGWTASSNPQLGSSIVRLDPRGCGKNGGSSVSAIPSNAGQAIAPWVNPPDNRANFLLRAHFTMPSSPWKFYLAEEFASQGQNLFGYGIGGTGSGAAYLNGSFLTQSNGSDPAWSYFYPYLVPGDNVLAMWIGSASVGSTLQIWYATTPIIGWVGMRLTFWQPDSGGQVYSWGTVTTGLNDKGALGTGDTVTHLTPTKCVAALPTNITKVVSNGTTTLFLTADQNVWACGDNSAGLLGIGSTDSLVHSSPVKITPNAGYATNVPSTTAPIVDISIGSDSALMLGREGNLYYWGPNTHGSFGRGDTLPEKSPLQAINLASAASLISCGGDFSVWADLRTSVYSAGGNAMGQLGQGTSGADVITWGGVQLLSAGSVDTTVTSIKQLAAGDQKLIVIAIAQLGATWPYYAGTAIDGSLGWGSYQAGVGPNLIVASATRQSSEAVGFTEIQQCGPLTFYNANGAVNGQLVVLGDGVPYGGAGDYDGTIVYGTNSTYQSGNVYVTVAAYLSTSKLGTGGPSHNPYASGNSQATACAIGVDGKLYTWGYGGFGQHGSGADPTTQNHAVSINGLSNILQAAMVNQLAFAIAGASTAPPVALPFFVLIVGQ